MAYTVLIPEYAPIGLYSLHRYDNYFEAWIVDDDVFEIIPAAPLITLVSPTTSVLGDTLLFTISELIQTFGDQFNQFEASFYISSTEHIIYPTYTDVLTNDVIQGQIIIPNNESYVGTYDLIVIDPVNGEIFEENSVSVFGTDCSDYNQVINDEWMWLFFSDTDCTNQNLEAINAEYYPYTADYAENGIVYLNDGEFTYELDWTFGGCNLSHSYFGNPYNTTFSYDDNYFIGSDDESQCWIVYNVTEFNLNNDSSSTPVLNSLNPSVTNRAII